MRTARVLPLIALAVVAVLRGADAESSNAAPNGLVILATDYGADSVYVGMIKGAIYSAYVEAKVDTFTNSIPSFDIVTGAYMLAEGRGAFPPGTTFCCVVDPGVGTERRCIVLKTKAGQYFVAPDNGILTVVADRDGVAELRECTNKELHYAKGESSTFHGRDIFGPVSAAIASGIAFERVGEKRGDMVRIDVKPARVVDGEALGSVMRADHYGNMVTTIHRKDLNALAIKPGDSIDVTIGEVQYTAPFAHTYGSVPEGSRLVLIQSSGFVECAINMGSLADAVKQKPRAPVRMKKAAR